MILFFEVTTPQSKKECIVGLAYQYSILNQNIQFLVEDEPAAKFLDQLLWNYPTSSFLPHTLGHHPKVEKIAIFTKAQITWPAAEVTFNLQNGPWEGKIVIELMDKTDAIKTQRSQEKWDAYVSQQRDPILKQWGRELTPGELLSR